jgi:hypothetical protein
VSTRDRPVVGWRLWKLHGGRLRSWVVAHDWEAGPNQACCLASDAAACLFNPPVRPRCAHSPGRDCKCGLWALWDFGSCARKAREESQRWDSRDVVIGLMEGWGTVAIHGDEGFRSQYAVVRCLFTDTIADRVPARADWWRRLAGRLRLGEPDARRATALRQAAGMYGVPLLSLADAVRLGVLGELGLPESGVREVAAALATG